MKAVVCTKYGGPEVLQCQEVDEPVLENNAVLIRINAAAVTTAGQIGRKGEPKLTRLFSGLLRPRKNILGMELAGEIAAVSPEVTQFKAGDQVFGLTGLSLGAHAQFKSLSEEAAITHMPANLSFSESAAVIEGGLTAINFLKHKAKVRSGQSVLIYGASGSVGTASVQLAKYLGAHVTGVCSTSNLKMVQDLGADEVIDYTASDFTQNGKTYDVIFDTQGKRSFPECKASLNPEGIYLNAAGFSTILYMLWTAMFGKKKAILATTYTRSSKSMKQDLVELKQLAEQGAIQPVIDKCYPPEEIVEASRYVDAGHKKGNVILKFNHA
ncbi:NAD(P)-dependent alcohol dehydrogenase [Roseivirga sp.]|uniref:NAD(P)-dependent alcohol dehydrogenase n=1 Tax=Roseivirga sp. TaxID=1964215 RepID=UPI003B529D55